MSDDHPDEMVFVFCPHHGQIMKTNRIEYAARRCYFLVGPQQCGAKTTIEVHRPLPLDTAGIHQ